MVRFQKKQAEQKANYDRSATPLPSLHTGETVRIQRDGDWKPAKVIEVADTPRSYRVETPDGAVYRRNRKHLHQDKSASPKVDTGETDTQQRDEQSTGVERATGISFEATRGRSYNADIALDDIMFKDGACNAGPNPSTAVPTTARPTTARPTTVKPTTARPTTARPTTAKPTTARPTTARPTTARPTTGRPTTARPTTARPTTARPTTGRPTTARPTTGRPTTARPTTARPTTGSPTGSDDCTFEAGQCFWHQSALSNYIWHRHTGSTRSSATGPDGDVTKNLGGTVKTLDCDFDQDMCRWSQGPGTNKYPWTRHSGVTPSGGTGPNEDHTTGKGSYVYMETSWQSGNGQTATLISPPLRDSSARCMSFFYSMNGLAMGSLNVYIQNPKTGIKSMLFTKSGDQGVIWKYGAVTIASICEHQEPSLKL
ncbi:hypothetical protein QZH41_006610 [Actinostola sp. cb2023]|nr:hypothetical protein QZH41_006610 [Actinostola sp. cb2023]